MSPPASTPTGRWIGGLLAAIGMVMIAVGLAWPALLPSSRVWSDEQAQELSEAQEKAHEATIGHRHTPPEGAAGDAQQARERYQDLAERLDRARSLRDRGGRYLTLAGTLLAIVGVLVLRSQRGN